MNPLERSGLIRQYQATRCDLFVAGAWRSVDRVPDQPLFLMSAWNPHLEKLTAAENARRDDALLDELKRHGLQPQRVRSRGPGGCETGWMFPFDQHLCLDLLKRFGQVAGVIWDRGGRRLLWVEGMVSPIDGDRCVIPETEVL
jgi:hypothetical protein